MNRAFKIAVFLILRMIFSINAFAEGYTNMETGITSILARGKELILALKVPPKTKIRILELKSYESITNDMEFPTIWEGDLLSENLKNQ